MYLILLLCLSHLFPLYVTFVPWHPEYELNPEAFIFFPPYLYDNYCTHYVYSDNTYSYNQIVFSIMPYNMCLVGKSINLTERIMVILLKFCSLNKLFLEHFKAVFWLKNILCLKKTKT